MLRGRGAEAAGREMTLKHRQVAGLRGREPRNILRSQLLSEGPVAVVPSFTRHKVFFFFFLLFFTKAKQTSLDSATLAAPTVRRSRSAPGWIGVGCGPPPSRFHLYHC